MFTFGKRRRDQASQPDGAFIPETRHREAAVRLRRDGIGFTLWAGEGSNRGVRLRLMSYGLGRVLMICWQLIVTVTSPSWLVATVSKST